MKRSKFRDQQILAILKEGEAGGKVADQWKDTPPLRRIADAFFARSARRES